MPLLTPPQAAQLSAALLDAFSPVTLAWTVRSSLGPELYVIVNAQQALEQVVPELLAWIERRGHGTLEMFLRGAIAARPHNTLLRDFCQQHFPATLQVMPSGALAQKFTLGLQLLIDMRDDPTVRQTVGRFRADLDATSHQMQDLRGYKGLHDCLHALQLRIEIIADALSRLGKDAGARRRLQMLSEELEDIATTARACVLKLSVLPARPVEDFWISKFESCIQEITDAKTAENAPDLVERLRQLLPEAPRINYALGLAANNLRLESFAKTMDTIAASLGGFVAPTDFAARLVDSSTAINMLRARLDGQVFEHNEWQIFSSQLNSAEGSAKYLPKDRMPNWTQFSVQILAMCTAHPDAGWSQDLLERMQAWIAAAPAAVNSQEDKRTADDALAAFHRVCIYRFYNVDKDLVELCGQVTDIAKPLDTLLNAIQ